MPTDIENWVDAGLDVADFDWGEVELQEIDRIRHCYAIARATLLVPRRLGPDADDADLKADRLLARRVASCYHNLAVMYAVAEYLPENVSAWYAEGARMIWQPWFADLLRLVDARRRLVATAGVKLGELRQARRILHRLNREADNIRRLDGVVR